MNSTSLEKTQSPVSGFCSAQNRECNSVLKKFNTGFFHKMGLELWMFKYQQNNFSLAWIPQDLMFLQPGTFFNGHLQHAEDMLVLSPPLLNKYRCCSSKHYLFITEAFSLHCIFKLLYPFKHKLKCDMLHGISTKQTPFPCKSWD